MKRISIYAISVCSLAVLFSACYYFSYKFALKQFNDNATRQNAEIEEYSLDYAEDVAAQSKTTVSVDAAYLEQTYDMVTQEQKEEKKNIPNDFVGLTRDQVVKKLNEYMQNKSLEEYNAGLVSWELVSFSSEKVIVKKTYNSEAIVYRYYMALENGEVVVYYSDKETVYDGDTGITSADLSEEDRIALMYGVYIKDEAELYSKLENYTS